MARAYKKTYLNGAMRNLAVMMDCGVRKYGYPIEEFYEKFLASDVSRQFAGGNPRYLVGMSGAELADTVEMPCREGYCSCALCQMVSAPACQFPASQLAL